MHIRGKLPAFDYSPMPFKYNRAMRIEKPVVRLPDGAEYVGEWDSDGKKDGRGM